MSHDSLGDRMKRYEGTSQQELIRRMPVIIRIDGRAFHTFTRRLKHVDPSLANTPFSTVMHSVMMSTTNALVTNVQGCVFGYTQSDEISLLLRDWDTLDTDSWFGNNVQKIVSLSAVCASNAFNYHYGQHEAPRSLKSLAEMDSRAFNIPKEDVTNYFIWRQQDASRNSVQMLGRFYFSQREMLGVNNSKVQDKLMLEKGVNWNDIPTWMKRGSSVARLPSEVAGKSTITDLEEIPIFTQDRDFIDRFLNLSEAK